MNSVSSALSACFAFALAMVPLEASATPPATEDPFAPAPAPAPMPAQPVAPAPAMQPQPAPQPAMQPAPAPAPAPQIDLSALRPERPQVSIDPGDPKKRIMGGILLGAGVAFSGIATVTFAGKAGQTQIGSQGLITFDDVYYSLQPRIPRVVVGSTLTVGGAVLAGLGANMFARHAGLEDDPLTTLERQRRLRGTSAVLIGSGGAITLTSLLLIAYGAGEWASIPGVILDFRPHYAQSAHNAAAFFSYGAGMLALGTGTLATGLGLLTGNVKAIRAGMIASRGGGGVSISGKF